MDEWYYRREEASFGPITGDVLHNLIRRKRVQDDTPVRRADETEWRTAIQVLPSLPSIPDLDPAQPESQVSVPHEDASLTGATETPAPPPAAPPEAPEAGFPITLWICLVLVLVAFGYELASFISMVFIHLAQLCNVSTWPEWLQFFAEWLTKKLGFYHMLASLLACLLATSVWQFCALDSLKNLYGDMALHSRAAGLWWFVPIANLFMPLISLRDMRTFSRARRDCLKQHAPFGPLLITMEILLLLQLPMYALSSVSLWTIKVAHVSSYQVGMVFLRDSLGIALSISIALVVLTNFLQQRRLHLHWNDKAYWDKPRQG
jgi:hypothetical protein